MNESRHVTVRVGVKEDRRKFWESAGAYAVELVEKSEETIQRGLDGAPVPSAHC
jgi:hypothetical protein